MFTKKLFSFMALATIFAMQGRADTQSRNGISVSLDDYVPYSHKFVIKEIPSDLFVKLGFFPLKVTVVNKSDNPIIVSTASIGGLPFVPVEKVASAFHSPAGMLGILGGVSLATFSGMGMIGSFGDTKMSNIFKTCTILSLSGAGLVIASALWSKKESKELLEEFKNRCIADPRTIASGERYEGFIFLTKEGYNNQLCNFSFADATNEEQVTAFAFHL